MKFKAYEIIVRAVDEGSAYGVRRAFKHTNTPTEHEIIAAVEEAIMETLHAVLDFEEEETKE